MIIAVLNVAAGKAPMQSSVADGGIPQKAVDGSTSTRFDLSTCSLTEVEKQPWWYVNLLEPYMVQLVRIDFGQGCCGECLLILFTVTAQSVNSQRNSQLRCLLTFSQRTVIRLYSTIFPTHTLWRIVVRIKNLRVYSNFLGQNPLTLWRDVFAFKDCVIYADVSIRFSPYCRAR